jgi:hypothetical protein
MSAAPPKVSSRFQNFVLIDEDAGRKSGFFVFLDSRRPNQRFFRRLAADENARFPAKVTSFRPTVAAYGPTEASFRGVEASFRGAEGATVRRKRATARWKPPSVAWKEQPPDGSEQQRGGRWQRPDGRSRFSQELARFWQICRRKLDFDGQSGQGNLRSAP